MCVCVCAVACWLKGDKAQEEHARGVQLRAQWHGVPPHLTLGITANGIDAWLQHQGTLAPPNDGDVAAVVTGRGNQLRVLKHTQGKEHGGGGVSYCEVLQRQGSPEVGTADLFVSWCFSMPMRTLVECLRGFLDTNGLPDTTKFWVSDFSMRLAAAEPADTGTSGTSSGTGSTTPCTTSDDLPHLGACVEMIESTVLVCDPWPSPAALARAFCLKEIYHTRLCNGKLQLAMSAGGRLSFLATLIHDTNSITSVVGRVVNVAAAQCSSPGDKTSILREFEEREGLAGCSHAIVEQLRLSLVMEGRAALESLPAEDRNRCPPLVGALGTLLQQSEDLAAGEPLLQEALAAQRRALGDRHPDTLSSINQLGVLLYALRDYPRARALFVEALEGRRETLGDKDPCTLISMQNTGSVLAATGRHGDARPLLEEAVAARREALGDTHLSTLTSMVALCRVLQELGDHSEARSILEEAVKVRRQALGNDHHDTLAAISRCVCVDECAREPSAPKLGQPCPPLV